MNCPVCWFESTKVVDSRVSDNWITIRRRRECESCWYRFTTFERRWLFETMVVKRDWIKEPYQREKVRKAMMIACVKREINTDEIERMIDKLELQWSSESELLTTRIGQDIMAYLKDLDFVAFIRFASVYQHFDWVDDFLELIKDKKES